MALSAWSEGLRTPSIGMVRRHRHGIVTAWSEGMVTCRHGPKASLYRHGPKAWSRHHHGMVRRRLRHRHEAVERGLVLEFQGLGFVVYGLWFMV